MDELEPTTFIESAAEPKAGFLARLKAMSKRTKLIIAASTVALLGGGGAYAYTVYQSPEVFVGTALASIFDGSHPGTELSLDISNATVSGSGVLDIYTADIGSAAKLNVSANFLGQPLSATLNVVAAKAGSVYANLSDYSSLVNLAKMYIPSAISSSLDKLLKDTWVEFSKSDLGNLNKDSSCLEDRFSQSDSAKAASSELISAARGNNFIVPLKELEQVDDNRVFTLGINAEKLKNFLKALKASAFYTQLQACGSSFEISDASISQINQADIDVAFKTSKVTLYADSFSHKLSKLEITSSSNGTEFTVLLKPLGDQSSKVVIPQNAITFTEFQTRLTSLYLGK